MRRQQLTQPNKKPWSAGSMSHGKRCSVRHFHNGSTPGSRPVPAITRGDPGRHADLFKRSILRRSLLIRRIIVAHHCRINTSDWQKKLERPRRAPSLTEFLIHTKCIVLNAGRKALAPQWTVPIAQNVQKEILYASSTRAVNAGVRLRRPLRFRARHFHSLHALFWSVTSKGD